MEANAGEGAKPSASTGVGEDKVREEEKLSASTEAGEEKPSARKEAGDGERPDVVKESSEEDKPNELDEANEGDKTSESKEEPAQEQKVTDGDKEESIALLEPSGEMKVSESTEQQTPIKEEEEEEEVEEVKVAVQSREEDKSVGSSDDTESDDEEDEEAGEVVTKEITAEKESSDLINPDSDSSEEDGDDGEAGESGDGVGARTRPRGEARIMTLMGPGTAAPTVVRNFLDESDGRGRSRAMTPEHKALSARTLMDMNVEDRGQVRQREMGFQVPPLRRALDDSGVGRRLSIRELEEAKAKATEKKARLGFGRRNKDKSPANALSPRSKSLGKDEHIEDGVLYFSDASCLSPSYALNLTLAGQIWPTCLHYYLANKISSDSPTSKKLHSAANSKDLKKFDASIKPEEIQKEWLDSRFEVMREVNLFKFGSNEPLCKKLLNTGDLQLVYKEADKYLGNGERNKNRVGSGENMMGEALMWVRGELVRRKEAHLPMLAVIQPEKIIPLPLPQRPQQSLSPRAALQSSAPTAKAGKGGLKLFKKDKEEEKKEKEEKKEMKEKEKRERRERERKEKQEKKENKKKEDVKKKEEKKNKKENQDKIFAKALPIPPGADLAPVEPEVKVSVLAEVAEPAGPRLATPVRSGGPPRRPPQRGHHKKVPNVAATSQFLEEAEQATPMEEEPAASLVTSPRVPAPGGPVTSRPAVPARGV